MKYRGIFIADIHIGALPIDQTQVEIEYLRSLLRAYSKKELLDFIIVGGDFFDKQFYSSDLYVGLAQKLMIWLMSSAKIVRCVYGTSSHDSEQYRLFKAMMEEIPDMAGITPFNFKVIHTVSEEELLPGMNVLYIPEEYIYNKNDYYREFFTKKDSYDYIFGHGIVKEVFSRHLPEKKEDTKRLQAPVFNAGELLGPCKKNGEVIFGHYHVHSESDNTAYVGSWSRWMQGEEPDKGLFYLEFEDGEHTKEFIVNTTALVYVTISYGYNDQIYEWDSDEWPDEIIVFKKAKLKKNIHKLRVIFNIPVGYDKSEAFIRFFRDALNEYPWINVEFCHGYVEKKTTAAKEKISSLPDEYKLFIDKNVPEEEKLAVLIKMKRGVELDSEVIKKYLEE